MQLSTLKRYIQGTLFSSLIVMIGYLLSRITGLLREMVISAQFGTSAELGAYRAAFKITDLLYMVIIGGALGSSFIPVFIHVWERQGAKPAWKLASSIVTWSLTLLAIASAFIWLFAPTLTNWFYGGHDTNMHTLNLTARLTQFFLLSPLLLGLGGLAMATLNARDHFILPALAPAIYNLGIIAGAIVLSPYIGIWGLAWGVVAGACFYLLIQLPGLWRMGMEFAPTFGREIAELRTIAWHMAPRVIGQAASQISILVTAVLTSRLIQGFERIAGLDYAYQLMLLPYGIFSLSLSTVAFPRLARLFAEQQLEELANKVRRTTSLIVLLTMPATVTLIVLGVPLVRVLFQRGQFDETSLRYTVLPLIAYATALPAFSVSEILIRTFYAMQQTYIPVLVGLLQVMLNLSLGTIALMLGGDVGSLALAFSIANNIEALLLFLLLQRQLPSIWHDHNLWRSIGAAIGSTIVFALMLWGIQRISEPFLPFLAIDGSYNWSNHLIPLMLWLLVVSGTGALLYTGVATLFGSHETKAVWKKLSQRIHL